MIATAQLHDNIWMLGYDNNTDTTDRFGISVLSFTDAQLNIRQDPALKFNFSHTNSSFADSTGRLLAFTNGVHIGNSDGVIMDGGSFIGTKYSDKVGYIWQQWTLMLPAPDNPKLLYCFYEEVEVKIDIYATGLFYALIDLSENNGKGKVLKRREILLQDTLAIGKVTSTRHANGRDWWIFYPKLHSNIFFSALINGKTGELIRVVTNEL